MLGFLPTVAPESQRAVTVRTLLAARPPARRRRIPARLIGGEADAFFPSSKLFFTALPRQAKAVRVPGAGHRLPIDRDRQTVATPMLEWLSGNSATR